MQEIYENKGKHLQVFLRLFLRLPFLDFTVVWIETQALYMLGVLLLSCVLDFQENFEMSQGSA